MDRPVEGETHRVIYGKLIAGIEQNETDKYQEGDAASFSSLLIEFVDGEARVEMGNNTTFEPVAGQYGITIINDELKLILDGVLTDVGAGGVTIDDAATSGSTVVWSVDRIKSYVASVMSDVTDPIILNLAASPTTQDGTETVITLTWTNTEANPGSIAWSEAPGGQSGVLLGEETTLDVTIPAGRTVADTVFTLTPTDATGNVGTAKTATVVYSASVATLFEWACDSLTAEKFDPTDGGAITTTAHTFVAGVTGNAIQLSTDDNASFAATDGNNINWGLGKIEFDFKYISGDIHSINLVMDFDSNFYIKTSSATDNLKLQVGGSEAITSGSPIITDGAWHRIIAEWDSSDGTGKLTIDGSEYPLTGLGTTPVTGSSLYLNGVNATVSVATCQYDNFTIR
jgi:hypothetical protein